MSLNIKNAHVHELARQAARLTGRSQTGAIQLALEDLLRSLDADPDQARTRRKVDLVREIALEYATDPGAVDREITTVDDLFDTTTGLPR